MPRFIHTADWQIGMKAAHVGAVGQRVRAQRLKAAQRVVEVATTLGCNSMRRSSRFESSRT